MSTLYEKLGGESGIELAARLFYEKIIADPRVNYFFEGVNMETQIKHMRYFMAYAFGAVASYTGKNMRESHQHLVDEMGLTQQHFDVVLEHLESSLAELRTPNELIAEVHEIIESTRRDVLRGSLVNS